MSATLKFNDIGTNKIISICQYNNEFSVYQNKIIDNPSVLLDILKNLEGKTRNLLSHVGITLFLTIK